MPEPVDVYLISGFLGAGKTTFLNRLVKVVPDDLTFLILMNEFGEVGLDGTLVEGEDLDMIEISKGSIFCACVKTDFIKALHEIAHTVSPDVMLIETTGVANPTDLDRDLKLPIFGGAFRLQDKFCLIDAANFLDTYQSFLAIEKQLASSDVFIINKRDLVDDAVVAEIEEIVREFKPDPVFYEATYADVPFDRLFHQGELTRVATESDSALGVEGESDGNGSEAHRGPMSEQELEAYIDDLLNDETAEVTPPDRLQSVVIDDPPTQEAAFRSWLEALPPKLVRAKGVLEIDGRLRLFNLVNGGWTLVDYDGPAPDHGVRGRLVVISRPEDIRAIDEVGR